MKNRIILMAIAGMFALSANAQHLGIKGGANFSNLFIDDVDDENMRIGYHFGAYAHLPVGDIFALQPEVLYSTKGSTAEYDIAFFEGESTFKLNYIDVPVMGIIKLGESAEIQAGPYFGFLMSSSVSTEGDLGDGEEELDNDSFKSLDYGLAAGLALNFGSLQLGARYSYGLQEIADSEAAKTFLGDSRNSYVQIFGALRFGEY